MSEQLLINKANILFLLIISHFVCDFNLQTDRMAVEKVQGKDTTLNWRWWLGGHCATHALAVTLITSSTILGFLEFIMHWIIDYLKGKNYYSLLIDQLLHLGCKLIYIAYLIIFSNLTF